VLTFSFEDDSDRKAGIKAVLYQGQAFHKIGGDFAGSVGKMMSALPKPERDAKNAGYFLDFLKKVNSIEGQSFYGGLTVGSHEVKISARALLDLLAGRVTQEQFFEAHYFGPREGGTYPSANPFSNMREEGKLITEIVVEENEGELDDDWLTIKFGDPDPAVTPFTVPVKE
jgi:hypothetical protein